jgi:hypothetical protein
MRILVNVLIVLLVLILFSFIGAIVYPSVPGATGALDIYAHNFFLLIIPVILMATIAHFLGRGIRAIKNSFEALGLAYVGAFIIGGVLAFLSLLDLSYSAHVNFLWLGGSWYSPWMTIFLIGTPIMLAFLV